MFLVVMSNGAEKSDLRSITATPLAEEQMEVESNTLPQS